MSAMTEPTFLIMLSLVPGAQHGYAIMQEVAQLSENRVKLSTGTLYTALKRLLDDGWIEQVDEPNASRGRKVYRLTASGRTAVETEAERLTAIAALARRRLETAS